jgi:hypothetical protein
MSAFGFGATALSLGLLQSEIQTLAGNVIALSNSLATLQLRVNHVIDMVNDLKYKTAYLDCDRSNIGLAYLGSSLNIASNCVVGNASTSQLYVNGSTLVSNNVQIGGNLQVNGNISYFGSNSNTSAPMIQF